MISSVINYSYIEMYALYISQLYIKFKTQVEYYGIHLQVEANLYNKEYNIALGLSLIHI